MEKRKRKKNLHTTKRSRRHQKDIGKYIGYNECPKCGKKGAFVLHWVEDLSTGHRCGPYLQVRHRKHDAEKYRKLRQSLSHEEVHHRSLSKFDYQCYIGKIEGIKNEV